MPFAVCSAARPAPVGRLLRILQSPCGHAVLLGECGSGRQTAVRLAALALDVPLGTFVPTAQPPAGVAPLDPCAPQSFPMTNADERKLECFLFF